MYLLCWGWNPGPSAGSGSTLELEPSSGVVTFKRLSHGNLLQQPQDSDKICISRSVRGANTTAPDRGQQPHRGLDWCHYTLASHCLEEKPWLLQSSDWNVMRCPVEEPFPPSHALRVLLYTRWLTSCLGPLFTGNSCPLLRIRPLDQVQSSSGSVHCYGFILKTRI